MRDQANVYGSMDAYSGIASVASFPATGHGVYDMLGNVWEWCEDTYNERLTEVAADGSARTEPGWGRVLRGGSWRRTIEMSRVSSRVWHEPEYSADDVGFRCAANLRETFDSDRLMEIAQRVFPVQAEPGREFEAAKLAVSDRRYLEHRAVTWLVLEGRSWEALPQAVVLLKRESGDQIARDLLQKLEAELLADAERGRAAKVKRRLVLYRGAVPAEGRLGDRRVGVEKELLRALRTSGRGLQSRGDLDTARECYRLALSLTPADPSLLNLLRSTLPAPGEVRVWAGDGREMVWIPSGKFLQGRGRGDEDAGLDEQPAHTVWVEGFWIDRTEVTNADYRRCVEAGACSPPHQTTAFDDPEMADHPVVWLDWYQARAYAKWAGKRLPSETEWERAARCGGSTRFPWGDEWETGMANSFGSRWKDLWTGTAPVGSFPPNAWGLLDMIGNAWEWVEDYHHSDYRGAPRDGRAWNQITGGPAEPERVLRGGSFSNFPPKLRVSNRGHRPPSSFAKGTGLRCATDGS
jgi:formylglycine-generating enzyme required for sulfatase activity